MAQVAKLGTLYHCCITPPWCEFYTRTCSVTITGFGLFLINFFRWFWSSRSLTVTFPWPRWWGPRWSMCLSSQWVSSPLPPPPPLFLLSHCCLLVWNAFMFFSFSSFSPSLPHLPPPHNIVHASIPCYNCMLAHLDHTPLPRPLPRPLQQGRHPGSSRDFALDMKEFEAAFTPNTKMMIINNPQNPFGKVQCVHMRIRTCICAVYQWCYLPLAKKLRETFPSDSGSIESHRVTVDNTFKNLNVLGHYVGTKDSN